MECTLPSISHRVTSPSFGGGKSERFRILNMNNTDLTNFELALFHFLPMTVGRTVARFT